MEKSKCEISLGFEDDLISILDLYVGEEWRDEPGVMEKLINSRIIVLAVVAVLIIEFEASRRASKIK